MKKIVSMVLLFLVGSVAGYFLKEYVDLYHPHLALKGGQLKEAPIKDSKSCVGLTNEETFSCIVEVADGKAVNGNDLFVLGQLYLYGFGTEVNGEQAVKALERSAFEFDNVDAMVLLGNLLVDSDRLAGQYWYSQAAQRGSLEGVLNLANIYRYSEADQNPAQALNLYQAAANAGSVQAQYELALIYAIGFGVEPNIERSVQILEIPCGNGHEESCILLKRIEELQSSQAEQAENESTVDEEETAKDAQKR